MISEIELQRTIAGLEQAAEQGVIREARPRFLAALTCAKESIASEETITRAEHHAEKSEWLDVDETVNKYKLSRRWLYSKSKALPFLKRISRKKLLVHEPGLLRWLKHTR